MEPKTLGQRIAARRKELGFSREDLAVAADVTVTAVQQWESGKTKNLKLNHLFALADALNVVPRWLAEGRGPKEAAPSYEAYSTALSRRDESESDEKRRGWEKIAAAYARAMMVLVLVLPPFLAQRAEAAIEHNLFCTPFVAQVTDLIHIAKRLLRQCVSAKCDITHVLRSLFVSMTNPVSFRTAG